PARCRAAAAAGREGGCWAVTEPELSFAGLLRQLRAEARLTQEELAEAASLSPEAVSAGRQAGHNRPRQNQGFCAMALGWCGPQGRWSQVQGDGLCDGVDAVTGGQQDPSAGQAADHLAVVVTGQGVWVVTEPAGVAQHRIDVPPAWVVGVHGG